MTTQHSTVPPRLRRRSDERVLGGVASGIGDYFNVDPVLIRILLVASLVFGGLGIFLYLVAWLLVPDESTDTSIAQRVLGGSGVLTAVAIVVGILLVGFIVFGLSPADHAFPGPPGRGFGGLLFAALVIGIGVYLFRRRGDTNEFVSANAAVGAEAGADDVDATVAQPATRTVVRREPRPASPLGWYAVGAALVGVGLLALGTSVWNLAVEPAHYFAIVFGAIAAALLVGAFWGHARFLILIGVLLLPFAWTASLVDVPIDGRWGSVRYEPSSAAEVQGQYRLAGGELVLDLTRVTDADEPIEVHARVAMGELRVQVPEGATVEVDASVGAGTVRVLDGPSLDGTRVSTTGAVDGGNPQFILDLDAGVGAIRVDAINREGN